jgi:MFS family permease
LHDGGTDHLTMRAGPLPHRDETDTERHDRNLIELLQEVRVVQTGVQVLFAFLLTVPFSARFDDITGFQRAAYFTALVGATAASVLLIAPTALHRILFRMGQKEYMVDVSNRLALGGLAATAIAMIAVMLLVSDVMFGLGLAIAIALLTTFAFVALWFAVPARRRRRVRAHYLPRRS